MTERILFIFVFFTIGCTDMLTFLHKSPHQQNLFHSTHEDCDLVLNNQSCLLYNKEIFKVSSTIPVDMVFVLDVSQSMNPILNNIGTRFSSLIHNISDFDWQMAFTTADHGDHRFACENNQWKSAEKTDCAPGFARQFPIYSDQWIEYTGHLPRFGRFMSLQNNRQILSNPILSSALDNPQNIFYHTITRHFPNEKQNDICNYPPYCQQGDNEQPLRTLASIFSQATSTHKDFFRETAGVVAFVVTNEPERAEDPGQATTAQDVLFAFENAFNTELKEKKLIVYGISIQTDKCLELQNKTISPSADYSTNLSELVEKTGGFSVNICEENYANYFSQISEHIHGRIQSLTLDYKPVIDAGIDIVIVNSENRKIQISWKGTVFENHITFTEEILPGSDVEVKYYYEKDNP